jgi:dCTP deaminase
VILSDAEIFEALDDGRLILAPEPSPRIASVAAPKTAFDRTAVNLHLGSMLRLPKRDVGVVIDPLRGSAGTTLQALYDPREIPAEGFNLDPGNFVLGVTNEMVTLTLPTEFDERAHGKPCLAARVEGKSSLARFGLLVHFTAPTIHAGFEGNITLEMMNLGPAPIRLTSGMPICQLIIEQVLGIPASGASQFQGQRDAAGQIG